jgi:competence protein ComEC
VLAVGWQPSVVRAGVAGALASIAWLTARDRDRWWLFLAGAAVLLAWNPYALLEPGFQLSFVAVAAIFVAVPPLLRVLEGYPIPRALAIVVSVSTACGLATAPILWLQFEAIPIYSVLANALAAPVVGGLLGLALVAGLLAPVAPSAAYVLAWLDGWLAAYLIACANAVAALPFAQLSSAKGARCARRRGAVSARLHAPSRTAPVACARPARDVLARARRLGRARRTRPASAAGRAARHVPRRGAGRRLPRRGTGSTAARRPGSAGRASRRPAPAPRHHAADRARPHASPARPRRRRGRTSLRKLSVGFVLDPRLATTGPEEQEAMREVRRRRVRVVAARAGRAFQVGRLKVAVLWPDGPGFPGEDPNLRATILLVSYGQVDLLLTADAESPVTLPLDPPPVEILKVAHHGSADDGLPSSWSGCARKWP